MSVLSGASLDQKDKWPSWTGIISVHVCVVIASSQQVFDTNPSADSLPNAASAAKLLFRSSSGPRPAK